MANQTINTQDSVAGSLLKADKAGKGDAKGGVFAKLIASFQKHIKQAESSLQVGGQKTSSKEKLALSALQTGLLKIDPESVGKAGKVKSSLKVAQTDRAFEGVKGQAVKGEQVKGQAAKGEQVKGGTALFTKSLRQDSNAQSLVEKNSEQQSILNAEELGVAAADKSDTDKLQKNIAIGLGVFQQESREPTTKTVGNSESKEEIFAGIEGKNNKNTENGSKSPRLVMNVQDSIEQKGMPVGQNTTEKLAGEKLVVESKTVEKVFDKQVPAKQVAQGRFSLNDVDAMDNAIDVSKFIKRDESVSLKKQSKNDDVGLNRQLKGEAASTKTIPLASVVSSSDDIKTVPQNEVKGLVADVSQAKKEKNNQIRQGLESAENVSKVKSLFKAVTANRSGVVGGQAQSPALVVSSVQSEIVLASSGGQDANTTGDDRGTGRSTAEVLMLDGSIRDTRGMRSDFAIQMAYRSAASFKASDAMLEISKAAKDGTVKLELMLEPATLGKIQVSLQTDAQKQIQVHLIVDQQASRQVLEQQLPQLRQALADQGLNLSGFTMDMNSQQQNDGKSSHDVAGMDHMNSHGETENIASLQTSLRMGVNIADDGSLSILA